MYEKTAIYTGLKKISDPQDLTYTIKATAHYIEKKSIFSFIVVDVAIMLFILFIIAFLYILHKKKKKRKKTYHRKEEIKWLNFLMDYNHWLKNIRDM